MPEVHQLEQQISQLGAVDIAVAIPSYNNAETIAPVVGAAQEALQRRFPDRTSVIMNADGGSKDLTSERFLAAVNGTRSLQFSYPVYPGHVFSPLPSEIPGRASALLQILTAARAVQARACVLLDASAPSITPDCVEHLLLPVLEHGFDLVTPRYPRPRFQGMLVSAVVYPLMRALYGKRLWQPIESDVGLSARLIEHYLGQPAWQNDSVSSSVDLWLSAEALCNSYKVAQAFVSCKSQAAREPAPHVEEMVAHVAGSAFAQMERTVGCWQRTRGSAPVPCFGARSEPDAEPAAVNPQRMRDAFRLGYQNLQEIWSPVLSPATLLELKKLALGKEEAFNFTDALWVRAVYDFALAYHLRIMNRDHLLRALTPLYLGWLASFALEMQAADAAQVDAGLERLCLVYEAQKPYLISRWRWPDRFNP
jgi:hypothetical protein